MLPCCQLNVRRVPAQQGPSSRVPLLISTITPFQALCLFDGLRRPSAWISSPLRSSRGFIRFLTISCPRQNTLRSPLRLMYLSNLCQLRKLLTPRYGPGLIVGADSHAKYCQRMFWVFDILAVRSYFYLPFVTAETRGMDRQPGR